MVVVLSLGGVQMLMLGVLGEYLWRTLDESRRRPRYFLEEPSAEPRDGAAAREQDRQTGLARTDRNLQA
jgi:hypothetical protein